MRGPSYPIDLIFVNSSTNLLHAEELASSGIIKHSPNPRQSMPEAKRPTAATAPESPVRCAKASATKASGGARRAERKKTHEGRRRAAIRSLTAADAAGATRGALAEVRGVWYRSRSRAYRRAEREDSLRDAHDAYDLDPCLDPTLHDQRTKLDPDTAEYGQSYPDGHDDVTTGAA